MSATEVTTTCACGCGTVVMIGAHAQGALDEVFVYTFDGALDYIELYVRGHQAVAWVLTEMAWGRAN